MILWRHADTLFIGGSEQVKALTGRKVRARTALLRCNLFDPVVAQPAFINVAALAVGFVANPHPELAALLIALPKPNSAAARAATLDELTRTGGFDVIIVNYPTFRQQFDIAS